MINTLIHRLKTSSTLVRVLLAAAVVFIGITYWLASSIVAHVSGSDPVHFDFESQPTLYIHPAPPYATPLVPTPSSSDSLNASTTSNIWKPTQSHTSNNGTPSTDTPSEAALNDFQTIAQRRIFNIINALPNGNSIAEWLSSLGSNGQWPDSEIDYTTGCDARRSNWPARVHWQRITVMSGAWYGGIRGTNQTIWANNATLRSAISDAMGWWFDHDFTNTACLDGGGWSQCPCDTPGLWNQNWFSNVILIPEFVGQTCLLLNDTLSANESEGCSRMTLRSFGIFDQGKNWEAGANILDIAKIGLDQGLRLQNESAVKDAYRRIHDEVAIRKDINVDGIRPDGGFDQHGGVLYNGGYGRKYTADYLDIQTEAAGTKFEADDESKNALTTLFEGNQWMIYRNALTGVLHWDFSVLGRFITFPVVDKQATASLKINLTEVQQLGQEWHSDLVDIVDRLKANGTGANVGTLTGNRMFWNSDYMVHRGRGYVTTVKMYSSRTKNSECTNSQNPFGFHLSDGAVYTYLQGDEYEDISAAWDWNLIPGITTDYAATKLSCDKASWTGVDSFVGGASDGQVGFATMRYTNPYTGTLSWQKHWFFFEDDVQHVLVSNLRSNSSAAVYSVLDQRRHDQDIFVDGRYINRTSNFTDATSFWHGSVGYSIHPSSGISGLSVEVGNKTGDWSTIGISRQPPETVDMFTAYLTHSPSLMPISYTAFPAASVVDFALKRRDTKIRTIRSDEHITAVFDDVHQTVMVVFWDAGGGSLDVTRSVLWDSRLTMTSSGNAAVIYQLNKGTVTVSDPTQSLTHLQIKLETGLGRRPLHWGWGFSHELMFDLPTDGLAGNSVTQPIVN